MTRTNKTTGYSPTTSHLRLRWTFVGVIVVAVMGLLTGAFVLGRASNTDSHTPLSDGRAAMRMENGVPVPSRQSAAGAATAAINFQVAGFLVAAGAQDGNAAATTLLAPDADQDARQALEPPTGDRDQLAATRITFAPLSTAVISYASNRAEVRVWGVSAASSRTTPAPGGIATWGRSTITVLWDGDQWRVSTLIYERGPWPVRADERLVDSTGDFGFRFTELRHQGWSYVPEQ